MTCAYFRMKLSFIGFEVILRTFIRLIHTFTHFVALLPFSFRQSLLSAGVDSDTSLRNVELPALDVVLIDEGHKSVEVLLTNGLDPYALVRHYSDGDAFSA